MANTRQVELEAQSLQVASDQTGFNLLITRDNIPDEMVDPTGPNRARSDGGDIRVYATNTQGNRFNIDVQLFEYDSASSAGDAEIRIHIQNPSFLLSSSTDTPIYMEYGDAALTQPPVADPFGRNDTWQDWLAVYHGGDVTDVTGNGANLTLFNTPTSNSDNWVFNGTNQYATASILGQSPSLSGFVIASPTTTTGIQNKRITGLVDSTNSVRRVMISKQFSTMSRLNNNDGSTNTLADINSIFSVGVKSFLSFTEQVTNRFNRSDTSTQNNTTTLSYPASSLDTVNIATRTSLGTPQGPEFFDGTIYHVAYRAGAIDQDYHDTWLNNQQSPSTFWVTGTPIPITPSGFQVAWAKNANRLIQ